MMQQYLRALTLYEVAHPEVRLADSTSASQLLPRPIKHTNLLHVLLEEGLIDSIPQIPNDAAADAFEPLILEGRPVSEEIVEGRR